LPGYDPLVLALNVSHELVKRLAVIAVNKMREFVTHHRSKL